MKKWNELITRKEIREMTADQRRRQMGVYTMKMIECGIDRDDARNMAASLMLLGEMAYRRYIAEHESEEVETCTTEVES